jgi:predicted permease
VTLYRWLLRLVLPPAFRREWGDAMADEARAILAEARTLGMAGRVRARLRLVGDVLRAAAREWGATVANHGRGGGMTGWLADLRIGARGLARARAYALAGMGTLGVAVGVNAVVLALVDVVLLRPLPYRDADGLVALWTQENWSRAMVESARAELRTLADVAGYGGLLLTLAEGDEPVEVFAAHVTSNLHEVLGVAPALGRSFAPDDAAPGAEPVTVLSHDLWVERFGADPGVAGRSIRLGGEGAVRRTVVGVMPAGYVPLNGSGVDVWVPVTVDPAASEFGESYFMQAVGRRRSEASHEEVLADVRRWAAVTVAAANPGWFSPEEAARADVVDLARALTADRRPALLLALSGVLLVLLVACANVANLALARTASRERELSLRTALGAARRRTMRLVLTETLLLGLGGAVAGLVLALALRGVLLRLMPDGLPPEGLALSARVVVATLAVGLGAALLAGLAPALSAGRRDPARALSGARGAVHDRGALRLQNALVAVQLGLATVLVASAGLLSRSLDALSRADPGFQADGAITFRLTAPPDAYPADADVVRFFQEARAALADAPGVEAVGFGSRLPMGGGMSRVSLTLEGVDLPEGAEAPTADHRLVTPGYLEALGVRLRAGRWIASDDDRAGATVAGLVNRTAAERLWPGEDPLGKRFMGPGGVPWLHVVGVIEDVREAGVDRAVHPALYLLHRDWPWRSMRAVVRTRGEPDVERLKAAVWSVSPGVPVSQVRTLGAVVAQSHARVRLLGTLAAVLGGVALVLGMVGVYGVVAYAAGRRRSEFGVRAALGAGRGTIERDELLRAGRVVAAGVLLGLPGVWLAGRGLGSTLFGVSALAPSVVVPVLGALAAVGLLAAWLPVRRASRVDPVEALRGEG